MLNAPDNWPQKARNFSEGARASDRPKNNAQAALHKNVNVNGSIVGSSLFLNSSFVCHFPYLFDPASEVPVHLELLFDHRAFCTNTAVNSQGK